MVTIFVRDRGVYKFPCQSSADLWVSEHESEYGFNKKNLEIFVDRPPSDSVEIAGKFCVKTCINCGVFVKFQIFKEELTAISCEHCGCRLVYQP